MSKRKTKYSIPNIKQSTMFDMEMNELEFDSSLQTLIDYKLIKYCPEDGSLEPIPVDELDYDHILKMMKKENPNNPYVKKFEEEINKIQKTSN